VSMTIPRVQLAFQGGGAKLLAMLPVAHAFSDCVHHEKIIEISAVAGTSAGSICAGLLAKNCDFNKLRGFVIEDSPQLLRDLLPAHTQSIARRIRSLSHMEGFGLRSIVELINLIIMIRDLYPIYYLGHPVLNINVLDRFLEKAFSNCNNTSSLIEQLPIKLTLLQQT
jgi:predicted acylesterase/phospholipase RssA